MDRIREELRKVGVCVVAGLAILGLSCPPVFLGAANVIAVFAALGFVGVTHYIRHGRW